MKKISFNDYVPQEFVDNESCRLITIEQYQEYQELKEQCDHWHKEAERISHEAIGARLEAITLKKKLAIATKALKKYTETETYDWIDSRMVAQKALKEMEGVK